MVCQDWEWENIGIEERMEKKEEWLPEEVVLLFNHPKIATLFYSCLKYVDAKADTNYSLSVEGKKQRRERKR